MFKVKANPTFTTTVNIPRADGEPGELKLEFRHKTSDELKEYLERAAKTTGNDVSPLMEIINGWQDVDTAFDEAALRDLVQQHQGAPAAIITGYVAALSEGRRGN